MGALTLLGLYRAATWIGAPLIEAELRRRTRQGKEDPKRLPERRGHATLARPAGPLLWVHAASVGESLAILPLIEDLLATRAGISILLTTTTVTSARLMAERLPPRAWHQFAPLDRACAWRRFLDHWRPDAALLVESELWPNLILETGARGVPLALVNARMSQHSFARWRRFAGAAAELLRCFEICLAQSPADQERFVCLGARDVRAIGNLKRAAAPLPADPEALSRLQAALGARPVWFAASTHPGEEEQVLEAHARLHPGFPDLLTIIAPRHPERGDEIARSLRGRGHVIARRSKGELPQPACAVYLADTLGELGLFYRVARIALIGGSLVPHGGQNPLEAARLGCPVLFGPHTGNFCDIADTLERRGGALRVQNVDDLTAALSAFLHDDAARRRMAERARAAAESERSVLLATRDALAPLLDRALQPAHARP